MERKKFIITLSTETIKQLNMIKEVNDLDSTDKVIELLAKEYLDTKND